jgi:hypothetical protein
MEISIQMYDNGMDFQIFCSDVRTLNGLRAMTLAHRPTRDRAVACLEAARRLARMHANLDNDRIAAIIQEALRE